MNVIKSGNIIRILDEEAVDITKKLPIGVYRAGCDKQGHFLSTASLPKLPKKVYGDAHSRIQRVFKHFNKIDRNLGVMLQGGKGLGKSLFTALTMHEAINNQSLPVVIVDSYVPAVDELLNSIDQDYIVVFDEFEKNYPKNAKDASDKDIGFSQEDLLSFFDGTSNSHVLSLVTLNDLKALSPYTIDRPGRFFYYFSVPFPTADEITGFMNDEGFTTSDDNIDRIIRLSNIVPTSWDILRAIRLELSFGTDFDNTIEDLNVLTNTAIRAKYSISITEGNEGNLFLLNEIRDIDVFNSLQTLSPYVQINPLTKVKGYENKYANCGTMRMSDVVIDHDGSLLWDNVTIEIKDYDTDAVEETRTVKVVGVRLNAVNKLAI